MFPKFFCLITLCTLSCTALDLNYFQKISLDFSKVGAGFFDQKLFLLPLVEMDTGQAIEECSQQCRLVHYFCHSFAVINSHGLSCVIFAASKAESIFKPSHSNIEVLALYETRKPEHVQDVAARFSHNDDEMPERDWASEILTKYGLLSLERTPEEIKLDQDVLRVCETAIHGEPPKTVNFAMASEHHHLSNREIMDTVKSWAQHSSNSETFSKGIATMLLNFLAIFSKNAYKDVTTFYDPTNKMLLIQSKDWYLFIVSFGPGHYEILRHTKSGNNLTQLTVASKKSNINDDQKIRALKFFQKAVVGVDPHTKIPDYADEGNGVSVPKNDEQLIATVVLITVAKALLQPLAFPTYPLDQEIIFYRDIVTAVLSSVYGELQQTALFQTSVLQKAKTGAFKDTSIIITHHK